MKPDNLSEWEKIGLSIVVSIVLARIIFFNESWYILLKSVLLVYWVFILPGIGITYLFRNLEFIERLAVSVAISAVLVGVPAYYLGLVGIHVKYSAMVLPALFAVVSGVMIYKNKHIAKDSPVAT